MKKTTVTKEEVLANMQEVIVRTLVDFGKPTTYVTIRMKNGFTLRESTTCVDPDNYNEEIGKQVCLKRLEDKVWFLLGYELQSKLKEEQKEQEEPEFEFGQIVLVREEDYQEWEAAVFAYKTDAVDHCYVTFRGEHYNQCIAFDGNEGLLGETDFL